MKRTMLALILGTSVVTSNLHALIVMDTIRKCDECPQQDNAELGFIMSLAGFAGSIVFGGVHSARSDRGTSDGTSLLLWAASGITMFVGWVYSPAIQAKEAVSFDGVKSFERIDQRKIKEEIATRGLDISDEKLSDYFTNQDLFVQALGKTTSISDVEARTEAIEAFGVSRDLQKVGATIFALRSHPHLF